MKSNEVDLQEGKRKQGDELSLLPGSSWDLMGTWAELDGQAGNSLVDNMEGFPAEG